MEAKKEIFDRVEQSFTLFKGNYKQIFLPLFVYNILSYVVFFVLFFVFMLLAWTSLLSVWNINTEQLSPSIFLSSFWIIILILSVILLILWIISILILYIPFFIWTVKTIKQVYNWEEINCKENIISSFSDILKSFKTYWYIFVYVFLIPTLLFIFPLLILIYSNIKESELIWYIAVYIFSLSILFFTIIVIYRWFRSVFSIYSAIDKNEYTKENFDFSISITKSKIWRIFWNFLLIWLIVGFLSSILEWIAWLIVSESWVSGIMKTGNYLKDIINYISSLKDDIYNAFSILEAIIYSAVSAIFSAFILVFSYIFFKRLEIENSPKEEKSI